MSLHPNTDHDEPRIRAEWRGCEWLGVESWHNSRPTPARVMRTVFVPELGIDLPLGSMNAGLTELMNGRTER